MSVVRLWPPAQAPRLGLVALAAALIMSAALGARQTFGLLLEPLAAGYGLPMATAALALATHNLVWGVAQPFAGAAADRYGAGPVALVGGVILAAGLALSALGSGGWALFVGLGLLVGVGISCTGFGVALAAVGKAAPPEKRTMAMGLASAGGSFGQAILVPLTQGGLERWGVATALLGLAGLAVAAGTLGPLLDGRRGRAAPHPVAREEKVGEALRHAAGHSGYRLLTLGFFVCGFQLAFIATYLPGYLTLCQMPVGLGATALGLIGLFNMIGSWGCGWLGGRYAPEKLLGWLYLIRGAAIAAFVFSPKSPESVALFAAVMGLTWLGTVPLTSGLIARMFGVAHLGTLFGVCFLSHQIGSFIGAWAGGAAFDLTGGFDPVWATAAAAGVVAAALHFAIKDAGAQPQPAA